MNPTPTRLLACLALASALPALAAPTVTYSAADGVHQATDLAFELHYVQLEGLEREVQARVNQQLRELVDAHKRRVIQLLADDPELGQNEAMPAANTLTIGTGVGVVTDDLCSVSLSVSTYFKAMANPDLQLYAATFDLHTGERISSDRFFVGGKDPLIEPISRKLQESYDEFADLFESRPRVSDLREVVVEPEGMSFIWGFGGLDAPRVVGPIMASLTWAELGDAVDRELLRSAIQLDPALPDLALGEDPSAGEEPAIVVEDPPEINYLMAIEDRLQGVVATISVEERMALMSDHGWRDLDSADALLEAMEADSALAGLAGRMRSTREQARSFYDAATYANLGEVEYTYMASALEFALEEITSGRVVTNGGKLLVREHSGDPNAWGKPIARLAPDTVVGVIGRAEDGLFHTVMLRDGTVGQVHKNYLLLESPMLDGRGRVLDIHGELVFGAEAGPGLVPMDGPGKPDAKLDAIRALLDGDETPALHLQGIVREIGFRPAWISVVGFTEFAKLEDGGVDEGEPLEGLTDKLPHK